MPRRIADTITLPDGQTYTASEFRATLASMFRDLPGEWDMDSEFETNALGDIVGTELLALEGYADSCIQLKQMD